MLYYLSVPLSVEEEIAPCVPRIQLGRFQVNCPSHYITFAVPRRRKLSLMLFFFTAAQFIHKIKFF